MAWEASAVLGIMGSSNPAAQRVGAEPPLLWCCPRPLPRSAITAELGSCNRDLVTCKDKRRHYLALYKKPLLTSALEGGARGRRSRGRGIWQKGALRRVNHQEVPVSQARLTASRAAGAGVLGQHSSSRLHRPVGDSRVRHQSECRRHIPTALQ